MSKVVKSQKVYKIELFGREEPGGPAEERAPWLYTSYEYDANGNLLQEMSYRADGETEQIARYAYDTHGKLCEERFEQAGDDFSEWREYLRDENGRLISEEHHFLDGSSDLVSYEYDERGSLIRKIVTDDEGEPEREELFMYENDKLTEEKIIMPDGEVSVTQQYAYHPDGKLMSHEVITHEGGGSSSSIVFYDETGNKIKSLVYNSQGQLVEISKWFYDEKNSLVKSEEETQHRHNVTDYEFDAETQVLKQVETDSEGLVISIMTRSFDQEGRVVESTVFAEATMSHPTQDYRLVYEYEFYTE